MEEGGDTLPWGPQDTPRWAVVGGLTFARVGFRAPEYWSRYEKVWKSRREAVALGSAASTAYWQGREQVALGSEEPLVYWQA